MFRATSVDSEIVQESTQVSTKPQPGYLLVPCLIVLVSLAVRLAAMIHWGTGAIESEGAEYARIAENLRNGVGYVGIVTPGPELMFPPLFPILIGAASFITGSYEWAGRLVSLVLGSLLPLPAFGIASRLFNRRVGFVAAALTILHPLLINLSFTVLTEGPYATLLLFAVYVALRAMDRPSLRIWCFVGGVFAVAYLLRQEAVAPLLIAIFLMLVENKEKFYVRCTWAAAAILTFLALAAPEIAYIYRVTGKLRLEGKSAITLALGVRIVDREAMMASDNRSYDLKHEDAVRWASAGINSKLERVGVWLIPENDVAREKIAFDDVSRVVTEAARRNIPLFVQNLSSRWLGAPFLSALALLGIARRPWRRPRALGRCYFLLVPATAIASSLSVLWIFPRYYFVLIPFLLIWAANGLVEIGIWTKASLSPFRWPWISPGACSILISGLLGLTVILYPISAIRSLYEFTEGSPASRVVRDAGLWVKQQQKGPITIMDRATPLAFHADAQFVYFPYCSGESALRFLDAAKVDYIVLRRGERFTSYYDDWLNKGIPDSRAQLVYTSSGQNGGQILVFRWHQPDEDIEHRNAPLQSGPLP